MKNINLFLVSITSLLFTGCATGRTGSVGHQSETPILTTNVVRTTRVRVVNGQREEQVTENVTIVSTQPVDNRTWSEKLFGLRPPTQTQVIPGAGGGANEYPHAPRATSYKYGGTGYNSGGYGYSSSTSYGAGINVYGAGGYATQYPAVGGTSYSGRGGGSQGGQYPSVGRR